MQKKIYSQHLMLFIFYSFVSMQRTYGTYKVCFSYLRHSYLVIPVSLHFLNFSLFLINLCLILVYLVIYLILSQCLLINETMPKPSKKNSFIPPSLKNSFIPRILYPLPPLVQSYQVPLFSNFPPLFKYNSHRNIPKLLFIYQKIPCQQLIHILYKSKVAQFDCKLNKDNKVQQILIIKTLS